MAGLVLAYVNNRRELNMLRQLIGVIALALLGACSQQAPEKVTTSDESLPTYDLNLISQFSLQAYQHYASMAQDLEGFENQLAVFLQIPTQANLELAQQAWLTAHNAWLRAQITTQLHFNDSHAFEDADLVQRIDSWPVMGGYIDYLPDYPLSGMVNDLALPIDATSIRQQQGFGISQGFHALEFMLWGETGTRSIDDFAPQENTQPIYVDTNLTETIKNEEEQTNEPIDTELKALTEEESAESLKPQNNMRRRQYIRIIGQILSEDIQELQQHWEPAQGYFTELLLAQPSSTSLLQILSAVEDILRDDVMNQLEMSVTDQHSAFNKLQHKSYYEILLGLKSFYQTKNVEQTLAHSLEVADPILAKNYHAQWKKTLDQAHKIAQEKALSKKDKKAFQGMTKQLLTLHSNLPNALGLIEE
jgi:putative iron-regulated protein